MADPYRDTSTGNDTEHELPPAIPRWVKVSAIVVGLLVVLFVALTLAGVGGDHGPGRHTLAAGTAGSALPGDGRR